MIKKEEELELTKLDVREIRAQHMKGTIEAQEQVGKEVLEGRNTSRDRERRIGDVENRRILRYRTFFW